MSYSKALCNPCTGYQHVLFKQRFVIPTYDTSMSYSNKDDKPTYTAADAGYADSSTIKTSVDGQNSHVTDHVDLISRYDQRMAAPYRNRRPM